MGSTYREQFGQNGEKLHEYYKITFSGQDSGGT